MKHSGSMETRPETRKIEPGDTVRLLQPFKPDRYCDQEYTFAIVVGIIKDGSVSRKNEQLWEIAYTPQSELDELVVYLYEPRSATTYIDQFGVKALFSFDSNEVELEGQFK